jgi:Xaa-Pro aminopeptidase
MLTAVGCKQRRLRFWERVGNEIVGECILLSDPLHLMYLANFHVDPFSLGADYGGLLELHRHGTAVLWHDGRLPKSVEESHVDKREVVTWYDGQSPARGPRRLALRDGEYRVHDRPGDPLAARITGTIAEMRRSKDPDEVALLKRCMTAAEAGFVWSRTGVQAGMTELDVYCAISRECAKAAGHAVIVYGDFAVCTGPERRGGPPTDRVIQPGDMLILDYSVVIAGYRSDFTNTLVVGRAPTPDQQRLYDLVTAAMAAGERELKAGASCFGVYRAVDGIFEAAGMADHFRHHAGHGIGLSHPEAPFFVKNATETLIAGDVVTLEPGLYVTGTGGIRIENNYLITEAGYEQLSHHDIVLR